MTTAIREPRIRKVANATRVQRSYYIRTVRAGGALGLQTELQQCWAFDADLPSVWHEVSSDETVLAAQLFPSSERRKRHDRRRILARFDRREEVAA